MTNGIEFNEDSNDDIRYILNRYKMDIDQDKILNFAAEILAQGFPRSVMEIDDK